MKTQISKLTMIAAITVFAASCGKKQPNPNLYGGYGYGGRCGVMADGAGEVMYSETGVGTAWRNNSPAELELTLIVDRMGRVSASGLLRVPQSEVFFSEGFGNSSYYNQPPTRGMLETCVTSQGGVGVWDDYTNQTGSALLMVGGAVELNIGPGAYVRSNGLFITNAQLNLRGYSSSSEVTFTPGGGL